MKIIKALSLILAIVCFCTLLYSCDFSNTEKNIIEVNGNVYLDSTPLKNVTIKSNTKSFCQTDSSGHFSFSVNAKKITIFAEKSGYVFSPNNIELTSSKNDVKFYATKIEKINGGLSLNKIIITPTSIVSMGGENFAYNANNQICLKVKSLNLFVDNKTFNIGENALVAKNINNELIFAEDLSIDTQKNYNIKFSLDVYFTLSNTEHVFTEVNQTILNISGNQTTQDLRNNQITYSCIGVNAKEAKFTYNISFIFDYFPYV